MKKLTSILLFFLCIVLHAQNYKLTEITIEPEIIGNLYQTNNSKSIILIIPGSGPTDRNGNSAMTNNNSLKLLAESLANEKINVFTYDKRVVYMVKNYQKEKKEIPTLDFKHGINDVNTIINYLKNQLKYKNIIIAGHSEGALIGMIAAQQNTSAYISLAGSGHSIDEILKEQINKQAPMLNADNEKILTELKKGNLVKDVNPFLKSIYAEQNQPFLIEWISYNPQKEIAKLKLPILIINGTKDIQVQSKEATALHQANPKSKLAIIENMNHIFKEIKLDSDNLASYNNPDLPIHPDLIKEITTFLKENKL